MEVPSALVGKSIPVHIWAEIIGLNWVKNNFKTRQEFGGRCDWGGSWEEVEEENKGKYDHDAWHVCMKFTKNKKIFSSMFNASREIRRHHHWTSCKNKTQPNNKTTKTPIAV